MQQYSRCSGAGGGMVEIRASVLAWRRTRMAWVKWSMLSYSSESVYIVRYIRQLDEKGRCAAGASVDEPTRRSGKRPAIPTPIIVFENFVSMLLNQLYGTVYPLYATSKDLRQAFMLFRWEFMLASVEEWWWRIWESMGFLTKSSMRWTKRSFLFEVVERYEDTPLESWASILVLEDNGLDWPKLCWLCQ